MKKPSANPFDPPAHGVRINQSWLSVVVGLLCAADERGFWTEEDEVAARDAMRLIINALALQAPGQPDTDDWFEGGDTLETHVVGPVNTACTHWHRRQSENYLWWSISDGEAVHADEVKWAEALICGTSEANRYGARCLSEGANTFWVVYRASYCYTSDPSYFAHLDFPADLVRLREQPGHVTRAWAACTLNADQWYNVDVYDDGEQMDIEIDDTFVCGYESSWLYGEGHAGIGASPVDADTSTRVDGFKVWL